MITNPVTEATSARARLADAMKRAQEQREREERAGAALLKPKPKTEEVEQQDESMSHQAATTMKHIPNASPSLKKAAKDIKPGIAGYRDRIAMLKAGGVKNEEVEQIDEISDKTLTNYVTAARKDREHNKVNKSSSDTAQKVNANERDKNRIAGMNKAKSYLTPGTAGHAKNQERRAANEEIVQEGRASQRHPLEGHEYHKKSDEALVHIAKDAHAAAEAMKSHNTTAENKYRDQANDSATVRHYRKTHGMADWYKKKYGHISESTKQDDKSSTALSALVAKKNLKQAEGKNKSQEFINKMTSKVNAGKRLGEAQDDPPFDKPYTTKPSTVTDKSGAKHSPMSRARDIARTAAKKQSEFLKARNAGSNTKNARARAAGANNSQMFESRQAEIVREAMKVAKEKMKKSNSEDKFIADPELNSRVIKTAAQM